MGIEEVKNMAGEISLEEYKRADREVRKERLKRGFVINLVIYIIVSIGLIIWNFVFYTPDTLWFILSFLLSFWGIGMIVSYLRTVRYIDKRLERNEALAESRARKEI